jgi:hypothetical protein
MKINLLEVTAAELQKLLHDGTTTSLELVRQYREQILRHNDRLKAMISIAPLAQVEKVASKLDDERRNGTTRSPLHGIPFIIKVTRLLLRTFLCRAKNVARTPWIRRTTSSWSRPMVDGLLSILIRVRPVKLSKWPSMLDSF